MELLSVLNLALYGDLLSEIEYDIGDTAKESRISQSENNLKHTIISMYI